MLVRVLKEHKGKVYYVLKVLQYTITLFLYLLEQDIVIVPDEIMRANQVRTSTVKTLSFRTDHLDKSVS